MRKYWVFLVSAPPVMGNLHAQRPPLQEGASEMISSHLGVLAPCPWWHMWHSLQMPPRNTVRVSASSLVSICSLFNHGISKAGNYAIRCWVYAQGSRRGILGLGDLFVSMEQQLVDSTFYAFLFSWQVHVSRLFPWKLSSYILQGFFLS